VLQRFPKLTELDLGYFECPASSLVGLSVACPSLSALRVRLVAESEEEVRTVLQGCGSQLTSLGLIVRSVHSLHMFTPSNVTAIICAFCPHLTRLEKFVWSIEDKDLFLEVEEDAEEYEFRSNEKEKKRARRNDIIVEELFIANEF
jgi:hypothetical protein